MKEVKCTSIRKLQPKEIVVDNTYWIDEKEIQEDFEGEQYAMIYLVN